MNKAQLIARVQQHMGQGSTRETATAAVDAVLDSIAKAAQQEKVQLRGFGSFYTKEKKARKGHHPVTGETLHIPARDELSFKAGKAN